MTADSYYRELLRRASRQSMLAIGFKGRAETVRTVLIWAATVLILYAVDWHKVPIIGTADPSASSEVRLGLCALGGGIAVFLITFLWQLFVQPVAMDQERQVQAERDASEKQTDFDRRTEEMGRREEGLRKEIERLTKSIDALFASEAVLLRLSDLHRDGRALYQQQADPVTWDQRMAGWSGEVEQIIRDSFSIASLHEFRKSEGGFEYQTTWDWPEGTDRWLKVKYSSRLHALDDIIRTGTVFYSAKMNMRRRAEAT